jgi:hypothetical protein
MRITATQNAAQVNPQNTPQPGPPIQNIVRSPW